MTPPETPDASIEEEIERTRGTNGGPTAAEAFEDADAEAAFWRAQFEQERERLAKLWVAYRDLEAELDLRKEEAERIAQRKAAATIAEDETETAPGEEPEQPGVLAIAPPDTFEVVCEAQKREVPAGRGTSFGLVFANRGDEPVTAGLTVEDVPDGWSALPTETTVDLDAHSSKTVYVLVRSPEDATPGRTVNVTVGVETPEGTAEPMELVAEVVEREEDGEQAAEPEALEEEVDAVIGAAPGEEGIDDVPAEETVEDDPPDGLKEDEAPESDEDDQVSVEGDDDAA